MIDIGSDFSILLWQSPYHYYIWESGAKIRHARRALVISKSIRSIVLHLLHVRARLGIGHQDFK